MATTEAQVLQTLNRSIDTAENQMQLLLGVAYRDADRAYDKWQELYAKHGFEKATKKFTSKPKVFGTLNGRLLFGFMKTADRKDAESARREFGYQAKRSHMAQLQQRELYRQKGQQEAERRRQGIQSIRAVQKDTTQQTKQALK